MEQLLDPKILIVGSSLIAPAKHIADYVKMNADLPKWSPPVVAFVSAFVIYLLVQISTGSTPSAQLLSHLLLTAGVAASGAVFTTEWHKATRAK